MILGRNILRAISQTSTTKKRSLSNIMIIKCTALEGLTVSQTTDTNGTRELKREKDMRMQNQCTPVTRLTAN